MVIVLKFLSLLDFHLALYSFPMINAHLDDFKSILDQVVFDISITLGIRVKTRSVIYFNHPWSKFRVQHNVEAQKFETVIRFFGLTRAVNMLKLRLNR
jgi:hypothetical protein